jgi:hypothetical protein
MPTFHKIDKERRLVMSSGSGVLNKEEALAYRARLLADPDFDSSYSQLLDLTHITRFDLNSSDLRQLAEGDPFSAASRRAFLVPNDLSFGLGRMYEIFREATGEHGIRIFRDLDDALDWVLARKAAP